MTLTGPSGPCMSKTTCPGTPSRRNWKCTARPSCCGASRPTATGSGPSRRTISPTCSSGTWGSRPGFCPTTPSGGTRERPARWWPCAAPAGVAGGVATGGVPAARPAPAAHAGAGLRLLAGPGALGLRRPGTAHGCRTTALPHPLFQRLPGRAGLPRQPPLSRGGGTDTRILLPVLLLPYRRYQGPVEAAPRQPASAMGGIGWKV